MNIRFVSPKYSKLVNDKIRIGIFRLVIFTAAALLPFTGKAQDLERPNILWITFEDSSPTLGCYEDTYANTPNIDRFAARSVRYTRAFAPTGVCATARSSLAMGMYASSIGTQHMRCVATLSDGMRPFPYYLRRDAGYYTSNNAKTDYNFVIPDGVWDESSKSAHWRNRNPGQPFFSVFNFGITHESRIRMEEDILDGLPADLRHDPVKANLPPYLPDTPVVRCDYARVHDLLTKFDATDFAGVLQQLDEDGLNEDTLIFVFSDHGIGLPRSKQFIFDSGMQVPLIIHFPDKWKHWAPASAGSSMDRMVSFIDFGPTVLSLVGLDIPSHMQGVPFLGGQSGDPRQFIYGIRNRMDERVDMNRTVRDNRFKYHRNYFPYLPHFPWLDYMDLLDTSKELRRLAAAGKLSGGQAYFMADHKAIEELYDLENDPYELINLAEDARFAKQLQRLREEHFDWVRKTVDTGLIPEQMLRDFADGSSEYEYARSGAYQLERCVATARLMEKGEDAIPQLIKALGDDYGPIRFWGAAGLANLGSDAEPAVPALEVALQDPEPEVALAAAEALCYAGHPDDALAVIKKHLYSESQYVAIAAGNVADRIGEQARPMRDVMEEVIAVSADKSSDRSNLNTRYFLFVDWLLSHALRELDLNHR